MTWEIPADVNDGATLDGADIQTWVDAITELQGVVGADETVDVALVETGSYTPTLTNITLSDGTNEAEYVFIGKAATSSIGILSVTGRVELGAAGALTGVPQIALPSGFEIQLITGSSSFRFGQASMLCAASAYAASVYRTAAATVGVVLFTTGSTYAGAATCNGSTPGTWTSGDYIRYSYTVPAVRV